ncbi:MAG: nucleoside triphosphate pyrophosphohydrolase [Sandaracinaceae bacterium]|nr:nucleoside triphosphate pyrophosphohydrolase [Sandaracinaceae bacterium]
MTPNRFEELIPPIHPLHAQKGETLPHLVAIMQRLLGPGGCPWDREQSFRTLRPYVLEEAHEVAEAIDRGDLQALCEELGDLLLQIVFQAELARKEGAFAIDDVIAAISQKLIKRHPHVFGSEFYANSKEVLEAWERRKSKEKGILSGVPQAMPALLRAWRISEKAARLGFDWCSQQEVRSKIDEELAELDEASKQNNKELMEKELGDLIFAIVNWARWAEIDPESALRQAISRFSKRVERVEQKAKEQGMDLTSLSPSELDALWGKAKAEE